MRVSFISLFMVFTLSFALLSVATAFGQDGCSCKGCGCKGGPGWRGPEGTCVAEAKLESICGAPAGAPCIREAVAQVCFIKPVAAGAQDEAKLQ